MFTFYDICKNDMRVCYFVMVFEHVSFPDTVKV